MHLHNTNSLYTKMLQVQHELVSQDAVSGNYRGSYNIIRGTPPIHAVTLELLKLDIVWGVAVDEGYILITVSEPRRWAEIEGEIHHIVARHIDVEDQPKNEDTQVDPKTS